MSSESLPISSSSSSSSSNRKKANESVLEEAIVRSSIDTIDLITPKKLSNLSIKTTADDLQSNIEGYQEFLFNANTLFGERPLADYQYLWLETIYRLTFTLVKLKKSFSQLYLHAQPYEIESIGPKAIVLNAKLMQATEELSILMCEFFNNALSIVVEFENRVQSLIGQCLKLLLLEEMEDDRFDHISNAVLQQIQVYLINHKVGIEILIRFSETVYKLGKSPLILPLLQEFDPELPMNLIASNAINLVDVMNFYRYVSFNLVSLSVNDKKYAKLAEIYFRILLAFPNLNLKLYVKDEDEKGMFRDKRDEFIINLSERQELSLMYVLNYLLAVGSLRKLLESSQLYQKELSFLVNSVSLSLSKDIDKLASQTTSTRSSMVSIPQYNMEIERKLEIEKKLASSKYKYSSLSSVIFNGSYKEKLRLVVNFGESLLAPNLLVKKLKNKSIDNNDSYVESNKVVERLIHAMNKIEEDLLAVL
ncbi:Protein not essential for viability [Candida albicans P60002]|nr:Protein not essential for viability [Candida albicans P60002]